MLKSNFFKFIMRHTLITFLLGLLVACSAEELNNLFPHTLSGSVGDGPITQAQISVSDASGAVVGVTISDSTANYNVHVAAGSTYPVLLTATGGTDVVTNTEPDFTMVSVASDSSVTTVNINPYSTLIVKTAQEMLGGLTSSNISFATQNIVEHLGFGLDPALIPDPINTSINEANVAAIVKASEALGEMIRRTRSALLLSGTDVTEDEIIAAIAVDMTDGVMDGRGPGADAQIAATANIVSGQVLVEALVNHLNVGGADATMSLDMAIGLSIPTAITTTADVIITEKMLTQALTTIAAAQAFSPSANLASMAVVLAGLSGTSLASEFETALPVDPGAAFNEVVAQVSLGTSDQLEAVNASVRTGGAQPAPAPAPDSSFPAAPGAFEFSTAAYTVNENGGSVDIIINRVGGSDGIATVQWRTLTFDGYGTADHRNDYVGTLTWTTVSFADGETNKTLPVIINADSLVESDETFSVLLQNPTDGAGLGAVSTALSTIVDTTDPGSVPPVDPIPPVGTDPGTIETADFYVATNGSDSNPGTKNAPFLTIQKAVNTLRPGQLAYVRGGKYAPRSRISINNKDGSANNVYRLFAYPGENVVISGENTSSGELISLINSDYWHLKGFEVTLAKYRGVLGNKVNYNTYEMIKSHHNQGTGISIIQTSGNNLILNCDAYNNFDPNAAGEHADGISISNSNGQPGNKIIGSRAWANSDDGIDVWNTIGATVSGNWSFKNGFDIFNFGSAFTGDGNGFKLGTGGGHNVTNNVTWGNRRRGYDYNGATVSLNVYNNTAWNNNNRDYVFSNGTAHVLRNNVVLEGRTELSASVNDQSNSWNLPITVNRSDFVSVDESQTSAPRNADGTKPNTDFLRPAPAGDLIDSGVDVGLPFSGSAPDLGAMESN